MTHPQGWFGADGDTAPSAPTITDEVISCGNSYEISKVSQTQLKKDNQVVMVWYEHHIGGTTPAEKHKIKIFIPDWGNLTSADGVYPVAGAIKELNWSAIANYEGLDGNLGATSEGTIKQ
jgi:hypothetical protein